MINSSVLDGLHKQKLFSLGLQIENSLVSNTEFSQSYAQELSDEFTSNESIMGVNTRPVMTTFHGIRDAAIASSEEFEDPVLADYYKLGQNIGVEFLKIDLFKLDHSHMEDKDFNELALEHLSAVIDREAKKGFHTRNLSHIASEMIFLFAFGFYTSILRTQ